MEDKPIYTSTIDALYAAIDRCEGPDFVTLGMLADAYAEAGEEPQASVIRWAIDRRRWPSRRFDGETFDWWWEGCPSDALKHPEYSELPEFAYHMLHNMGRYKTKNLAFRDLCRVMCRSRGIDPRTGEQLTETPANRP